MNEDIDLRIKFIQEIERHPYLYDHNHLLYNHREKIEATWKKIGQIFGETSLDCKKKWRLIRCSYTRSLKKKPGLGITVAKGRYYMAPHLHFLDPFLKSRSCQDNNSEEDDADITEESMENMDGMINVAMDEVKVERDDENDYENQIEGFLDYGSAGVEGTRKRTHCDDPLTGAVKKNRENAQETNKDLNPSQMYLLSLAPYFESMSERQQLTFRKGVVELIETIKYGS